MFHACFVARFFFNETATTEIYTYGHTLSLHDALPICGIAYLPVGAPTFDRWGADRKGANLYSNSVVAVDAATGKYLWHFQTVHHDIWDLDLPTLTLVDIKRGGRVTPALVAMNKTAIMFILDRVTGKPLFDVREVPVPTETDVPGEQPWPTQPLPVAPPPLTRSEAPT